MGNKSLIQRLAAAIDANKNSSIKKDNLTDVANQISNQPNSQQPAQQPQSSTSSTNQNLGSNQVIASDGTVIDLGINQQNTIKK